MLGVIISMMAIAFAIMEAERAMPSADRRRSTYFEIAYASLVRKGTVQIQTRSESRLLGQCDRGGGQL
jgi:hypothetical protein